MEQNKIERINFLYKKSKTQGLTECEKAEQQKLRKEYIKDWKSNLTNTLNNVYVVDKNGNKQKINKKCNYKN